MNVFKLMFERIAGNKLLSSIVIAFVIICALSAFYLIFSPYENCLRDYTYSSYSTGSYVYQSPPEVYCNRHTKW